MVAAIANRDGGHFYLSAREFSAIGRFSESQRAADEQGNGENS